MYLAGRLPHRSAQSEEEREASAYIADRLREYTPDVSVEPFHAPENYPYLFASYMSEFLIVGAIAFLWPEVAFGYGLGVFALYLAEFAGYRGLSRFMPQYPSQNVTARFLGLRPRATIVFIAYYDSGCASPLTLPERIPLLRPMHLFLLSCMVLVLATCAADALSGGPPYPGLGLRWIAIAALGAGALALFLWAGRGEDIRGANNNASGVAALLGVAEALRRNPVEEADVWIVALGSHEAWMSGMRHFLPAHRLPRDRTYFINLEAVGAGRLHYLKTEGFLYALRADKQMTGLANAIAADRPVRAGVLRAVPTAAHVPLSRGMKALTVMGLDDAGLPAHWNQLSDRFTAVEEKTIEEAIDFTLALARRVAAESARE